MSLNYLKNVHYKINHCFHNFFVFVMLLLFLFLPLTDVHASPGWPCGLWRRFDRGRGRGCFNCRGQLSSTLILIRITLSVGETYRRLPIWCVFTTRAMLRLQRHEFRDFTNRRHRAQPSSRTTTTNDSLLQPPTLITKLSNLLKQYPNFGGKCLAEIVQVSMKGRLNMRDQSRS